jgi:hypothetical protein
MMNEWTGIRAWLVFAVALAMTGSSTAQTRSYSGIYTGQTNDLGSGSPSGFALFIDASQNAVLIGGDQYNDYGGTAFYVSCVVDANGRGSSDISGLTTSFAVSPDGSAGVSANADVGSSDYPWSYSLTGNAVRNGPFQSVSGLYSGTASGQTLQDILAPDGEFYSSSPGHGGGSSGWVPAYEQPVTLVSLGHMLLTITLHADATISVTTTNVMTGASGSLTLTRVEAVQATPPPMITGLTFSSGNLTLTGTNGVAGRSYSVLATTELSAPLNQWTGVATNTLTTDGSFAITISNAVNPAIPHEYYILRTQ